MPVELLAQEDRLFLLAVGEGPEGVAHAPLADHLAGHLRGLLDVVLGARGDLAEGQLFGDAAAHADRDAVLELLARPVVLLLGGKLLGHAQGHAARDDRDLVQGIGVGKQGGEQGVAALVEGGDLLLLVRDDHALALGPHEDLVLRALEVAHGDELLVVAGGQEGRFVHEVREVGPREAGRGPGEHVDGHVVGEGDLAGVHLQDALAAADVGAGDHHPPVEAAGAQEGGVEDVGPVGGRDQDDPVVRLEAVHLHEELVQGLLALVVAAAQAGPAVATHGVDLVDEDDAGRVLLALLEEVADAGRAHPHEHLHEVGARDGEEGHVGLARRWRGRGGSCPSPEGP